MIANLNRLVTAFLEQMIVNLISIIKFPARWSQRKPLALSFATFSRTIDASVIEQLVPTLFRNMTFVQWSCFIASQISIRITILPGLPAASKPDDYDTSICPMMEIERGEIESADTNMIAYRCLISSGTMIIR